MPVLLQEDLQFPLSIMYEVRQIFPRQKTDDAAGTVKEQLSKPEVLSKARPGAKVAVTVGNRGIRGLSVIVKSVLGGIQAVGGDPFIVLAMGGHDSGTSEGQRKVLGAYGIAPESMRVPVIIGVDVELLGATDRGIQVYFGKTALHADLIVPINCIKLYTDFVADIQSGLCKMPVIGLGNHKGCTAIHEDDLDRLGDTLLEAVEIVLKKVSVGFGVGIVENVYDGTALVEVIPARTLIFREKELVEIFRSNMPSLMIPEADFLTVKEISKNISEAGYDSNTLGKSYILRELVLEVSRINCMILLDITEQSHGNAVGTRISDVITRKVFDQLDLEAIYANSVAVKCIDDAKTPPIAADEEEAARTATKVMWGVDKDHLRIVKIKNTLELEMTEVSDILLDYVAKHERLSLL